MAARCATIGRIACAGRKGGGILFFFVPSLPTRIQRRLTVPTHRHVRYCWRAIGLDVITPLLLPHIPSRFLPFYLFFFFLLLLQMMEIISMPTQPLCTYWLCFPSPPPIFYRFVCYSSFFFTSTPFFFLPVRHGRAPSCGKTNQTEGEKKANPAGHWPLQRRSRPCPLCVNRRACETVCNDGLLFELSRWPYWYSHNAPTFAGPREKEGKI